jgi:predicted transcriptional regulator
MPNGSLMTSPEVAVLLGCSIRTVHRLVTSQHLIPAQKLPGPNGAFLFSPAAVEMCRRQRTVRKPEAAA